MDQLMNTLQSSLGEAVPRILGAIAILLIGWIVAIIVRAVIRKGLGAIGLNQRVAASTGNELNLENGIALGAYLIVMLMVVLAFFNALRLEVVSGTLQSLLDQVMAYLPKLLAGGILVLVAWGLATVVRTIVTKALESTKLDERLSSDAGMTPISKTMGSVLFALVFILFLPAILDAFELTGLMAPVQEMVDKGLDMLPNLLAAVAIGLVGWFVARIVRDLVTNLLHAVGADKIGEQVGMPGLVLSRLAGTVVMVFIFVPALIAALDALAIESISAPASDMLNSFMAAVPNVFAAAVILGLALLVARVVGTLLTKLLSGLGFDGIPAKVGMGAAFGSTSPSAFAGRVVVFFIMLVATVEAANRLGFAQVSQIVASMIDFGGQVLLGIVIIGIGVWIAGIAHEALLRVNETAVTTAGVIRFAILGIVVAMGLRSMGLADDIVNMAFGLTLGALAVAFALSFGLGGREAAGKQMEHWLAQLRK